MSKHTYAGVISVLGCVRPPKEEIAVLELLLLLSAMLIAAKYWWEEFLRDLSG